MGQIVVGGWKSSNEHFSWEKKCRWRCWVSFITSTQIGFFRMSAKFVQRRRKASHSILKLVNSINTRTRPRLHQLTDTTQIKLFCHVVLYSVSVFIRFILSLSSFVSFFFFFCSRFVSSKVTWATFQRLWVWGEGNSVSPPMALWLDLTQHHCHDVSKKWRKNKISCRLWFHSTLKKTFHEIHKKIKSCRKTKRGRISQLISSTINEREL